MNEQLLKTSGADDLSYRKKLGKPDGGGGVASTPSHPLVRPRVEMTKSVTANCVGVGSTRSVSIVHHLMAHHYGFQKFIKTICFPKSKCV